MTSLLVRPDRPETEARQPRPLVLIATLAGAVAALGPLLVLLAVGVVGWFLSDAGAHGAPRDGMQVLTLGWLAAHGSGFTVEGVRITAVPLGITLGCAWVIWRTGLRAGEALADHGPDEHSRSDGERDWTVPTAVVLYLAGYSIVAVVAATLAAGPTADPSLPRVLATVTLLVLSVAAPAITIGSGRAETWLAPVPATVRVALAVAGRVLLAVLAAAGIVFLVALVWNFSDAATMTSRLHPSPGEASLFVLVNAAYAPNAVLFSASWLLGPGFTVGAGTLVTPGAVVLGPLPLFPLVAALPDAGTPAAWLSSALALPPLVSAVAAVWVLRRHRLAWDQSTLAACCGGIVAGVGLTLAAAWSGGAVGPGRMSHVGPVVGEVLVHAVTTCAIGALVGAVALLAWQRLRRAPEEG